MSPGVNGLNSSQRRLTQVEACQRRSEYLPQGERLTQPRLYGFNLAAVQYIGLAELLHCLFEPILRRNQASG